MKHRWTPQRQQLVRELYPLAAHHPDQVQALAKQLEVTPRALHEQAKRLGLRRRRGGPRTWSEGEDALLRRHGAAATAQQLGLPLHVAQLRHQQLERRRRARAGDWSEQELEAVRRGRPVTRPAGQQRLQRTLAGLDRLGQEPALTLDQAAHQLGVDPGVLVQAALRGELAAQGPGIPRGSWETTPQRLGGWILSCGLPAGSDVATALAWVFRCGVGAAQRLPEFS